MKRSIAILSNLHQALSKMMIDSYDSLRYIDGAATLNSKTAGGGDF